MTRYAIDAATGLRLIQDQRTLAPGHALVGAAALRSQVMALLYRQVRAAGLDERAGTELLERLAGLKIRLLGDRGSRAQAWRYAVQDGRGQIGALEYLAVAVLQADALITQDADLIAAAAGRIPVAEYEDLFR
ncbi:hypothetical protein GCM10022240_18790 [Microbacterium kribbense]|uniref:Type II toxin-antitoxin system VapC family toxin n=1 Tax=Microbacterium kribbense TaxID=433645 RepID=A0ABP7GI57_9MICO